MKKLLILSISLSILPCFAQESSIGFRTVEQQVIEQQAAETPVVECEDRNDLVDRNHRLTMLEKKAFFQQLAIESLAESQNEKIKTINEQLIAKQSTLRLQLERFEGLLRSETERLDNRLASLERLQRAEDQLLVKLLQEIKGVK